MVKIWQIFLVIALIAQCSCSTSKRVVKNSQKTHSNFHQRVKSKISDYVKPSEAMQAGVSVESNYYDSGYYNSYEEFLSDGSFYEYDGHFKVGQPYEVFGVSYIPQNYENYEEIGIASWYGDDFHGKKTANGEIYDMESMTAAHPTLPLPSLVRVTNLENSKSVIVRVNDRGPFSKNRVIDLSQKAAEALDFKDSGTAQVKVELMRNETDELLDKLKVKN